MTGSLRNRKALLVAGAALACAAAALTIAYPRPVANPMLGAEWQCYRSAAIVTTCRHLSHTQPTIHRTHSLVTGVRRV